MGSIPIVISDEMYRQLSVEFMAWKWEMQFNKWFLLKLWLKRYAFSFSFQNYWQLVGCNVTQLILHFLNSASLPNHLNYTFITLIPKVKNLKLVSKYRPISLCNVLYKKISKVLANRLNKILSHIITKHQSAFTKSCLISDNILVAFETLQSS